MKLNYKNTIVVGFAFFAITLFWQIYDSIVPKVLNDIFMFNNTNRGIIMALDNIVALAMLPLFGHLSDRTKSRWGRRTPYIVCGTVLSAAAFVAVGACANAAALIPFIVCLALNLIFMSTYRSPAVSLMPDITIKPLRSKANAVINLMGAVGGVIALAMIMVLVTENTSSYFYAFIGASVVMLLSLVAFIVFVNEKKLVQKREAEEKRLGIDTDNTDEEEQKAMSFEQDKASEELTDTEPDNKTATTNNASKLGKPERRSMIFLLLSVVFWFMAYNAVTSSFSVYASEVWNIKGGSFSLPLMVASGAAILSYVPVGIIANKIGRKKTIFIGLGFMFAAFLGATIFGTTWFGIKIDFSDGNYFSNGYFYLMCFFFALCGIGWATISVNSYPMAVEMSKAGSVGKYTGYYYTASMAAQSLTPFISGVLMDLGKKAFSSSTEGMMLLFPYALFFIILAAITMIFVRHGDVKPEFLSKLQAFDVED